ncbi:holo-ACP synthase [Ornithinibacillus halotolerans]|uniref:Holo-[acyl-carrier-protein] synthase n=1 Tax=Ornithinibacillus halotolerans TaxID=1274357 RepID=A0A916SC87_9BACI|nr:holo-ACP synthase [Ornithinibacillus halotolerans]GGA92700.1 holo-[acyl-carrier-protein] synthase [Ornithinibacillus halotolerans]
MIKGIGIDIVELERIKQSMENRRFIERILTLNEREKFDLLQSERRRMEYVAGRFAAKEAFSKAMGTGIGKLSFQDIEVMNDDNGAPTINLTFAEDMNIFVSISHSKEYAVAQVIIEE